MITEFNKYNDYFLSLICVKTTLYDDLIFQYEYIDHKWICFSYEPIKDNFTGLDLIDSFTCSEYNAEELYEILNYMKCVYGNDIQIDNIIILSNQLNIKKNEKCNCEKDKQNYLENKEEWLRYKNLKKFNI